MAEENPIEKIRFDLRGVYRYFEEIFDRPHSLPEDINQCDAVFNRIRSASHALNYVVWFNKHEGGILRDKIEAVVIKWYDNHKKIRSTGANLSLDTIPEIKNEILRVIASA